MDGKENSPQPLSLTKNILWNSIGSMFYLVCQWVITILVVRLSSGFDAAGLFSLATSVVGTFGTLANYKIGTYQISDIHRENAFSEYLAFRCLTLCVSFLLCLLYALVTCPLYSISTVILYFIYKSIGLVIDIFHGEDQLNRRMDYIGKSFILQGVISITAFSFFFPLTQSLNLAIIAMSFGVLGVLLLFDCRNTSQFQNIALGISKAKALHLLKKSLPAVIASVAASAIFTIPRQYLLGFSGDAALGIYSSIAAPCLVVQMGAQYLYGPLLDVFPRKFFDGCMRDFKRLLFKTSLSIIGVAIVCGIGLFLLGEPLLAFVFGDDIRPYVYLLQPVLLSTLLTAFLWFFGDLLITVRDFKAYFIGNILALFSTLPLSAVCIPLWGMNGVSFASSVACACGITYLGIALKNDTCTQLKCEKNNGQGAANER